MKTTIFTSKIQRKSFIVMSVVVSVITIVMLIVSLCNGVNITHAKAITTKASTSQCGDWRILKQALCVEHFKTKVVHPDDNFNHKGVIVIEEIKAKVLDIKGNGKILNTKSKFNYIKYPAKKYKKGSVVWTYVIYNPYNNAPDDIVDRHDFTSKQQV